MNKKNFTELKKYIDGKIQWTQDNCQSKLMELTILYSKCVDVFSEESLILNDLELQRDTLYGELLEHLKFNSDKRWDTKGEIESQMFRDVNYQSIIRQINEQKSVTDYLGRVFEMIKSTQFAIKNYMDWEKFKNAEKY